MTKFYISLNTASSVHYYWNQKAQNWTSNPKDATLFMSDVDAEAEANYANEYGPGEALICATTKTLDNPTTPTKITTP